MSSKYIVYGYEYKNTSFLVDTDFVWKDNYYYSEKHDDYLFERWWRNSKNGNSSWTTYKNIWYSGSPYRYTYWTFCIKEKEQSIFIEKKKDLFMLSIRKVSGEYLGEEIFSKTVNVLGETVEKDLEVAPKPIEEIKNDEEKKKMVKDFINQVLHRYESLYKQIQDKNTFLNELENRQMDYFCGDETEEELEEERVYAKCFFVNFIASEKIMDGIQGVLNKESLLKLFPYIQPYIDRIDFSEILSFCDELKHSFIEHTKKEVLDTLKEALQYQIEELEFQDEKEKYDVSYVIRKYQITIESIVNKKDFYLQLEEQLEKAKHKCNAKSYFWAEINGFIERYARDDYQKYKIEEFINKYGSDKITISLTEDKKKRFETTEVVDQFSVEERKEYELYQDLKAIYDKEMYFKNGKTLKYSFRAIPTFISFLEKLRDVALQEHLIEDTGDSYKFVSFENIKNFIKYFQ